MVKIKPRCLNFQSRKAVKSMLLEKTHMLYRLQLRSYLKEYYIIDDLPYQQVKFLLVHAQKWEKCKPTPGWSANQLSIQTLLGFFFSWVWFLFLVGFGFFVLADMLTWSSSLPNALILWLLHLFGQNVDIILKDC